MFNTIVNTNSQFGTNTTDRTHTTTHDESYTLTLSEENSHSRSDGGEVIDETNWSDYSENSSSDEYSRMEAEHYNEAKKKKKKMWKVHKYLLIMINPHHQ